MCPVATVVALTAAKVALTKRMGAAVTEESLAAIRLIAVGMLPASLPGTFPHS